MGAAGHHVSCCLTSRPVDVLSFKVVPGNTLVCEARRKAYHTACRLSAFWPPLLCHRWSEQGWPPACLPPRSADVRLSPLKTQKELLEQSGRRAGRTCMLQ